MDTDYSKYYILQYKRFSRASFIVGLSDFSRGIYIRASLVV